jgi:hypothetical protein
LRALLRRSRGLGGHGRAPEEILRFADLTMNLGTWEARLGVRPLEPTRTGESVALHELNLRSLSFSFFWFLSVCV